jgi:hypothetical protein
VQHLQIQHTLDVMHVENNICESLVRTFLVKKTIKVKWDMEVEGVHQHLWLT